MRSFRAVVFDLDATLVDETDNIRAAYLAAARHAARRHGVDTAQFAVTAPWAAQQAWWEPDWLGPVTDHYGLSAWDGLSEKFCGPGPDLRRLRAWLPEYRRTTWRAAYRACGLGVSDQDSDLVASVFRVARHRRHVALTAGTDRLLAHLAGRRLAVVTNGPVDGQTDKIRRAGLDGVLDLVLASTGVGVGKPDPALLGECLSRLRSKARDALVIGDNLEHDIRPAADIGCHAIWVCGDHSEDAGLPENVAVVASTVSVLEVVRTLEAG